jgi:hypothetical protein
MKGIGDLHFDGLGGVIASGAMGALVSRRHSD